MTHEEDPIKITEVAERLNASTRTVRRWIGQGLPAYRPGKAYYFYMSEVNKWMRKNKNESHNAHSG